MDGDAARATPPCPEIIIAILLSKGSTRWGEGNPVGRRALVRLAPPTGTQVYRRNSGSPRSSAARRNRSSNRPMQGGSSTSPASTALAEGNCHPWHPNRVALSSADVPNFCIFFFCRVERRAPRHPRRAAKTLPMLPGSRIPFTRYPGIRQFRLLRRPPISQIRRKVSKPPRPVLTSGDRSGSPGAQRMPRVGPWPLNKSHGLKPFRRRPPQ